MFEQTLPVEMEVIGTPESKWVNENLWQRCVIAKHFDDIHARDDCSADCCCDYINETFRFIHVN